MEDVKPPHPPKLPMTPLISSVLTKWLTSQGLADLTGAFVNADRHDTWTLDRDPAVIGRDLQSLYTALSNPPSAPNGPLRSDTLTSDLTYILGYLRTSHSVQVLCLFNARWPGIVDYLLSGIAHPSLSAQTRAESALLTNRILYLIRHHAAPAIFSPERRAEVQAAIAAARVAGMSS